MDDFVAYLKALGELVLYFVIFLLAVGITMIMLSEPLSQR